MDETPFLYYVLFEPQKDITRDEVCQIFNGIFFTIAERDGFSIAVDDDISTDDILHLVKRFIYFVWSGGTMPCTQEFIDKHSSTQRHFRIFSKVYRDRITGKLTDVIEEGA